MTNTNFWSEITEVLWADIESNDSYPTVRPLLAHYTSVTTLEQMLRTEEVWFSNPLYMNDWEELRFGMHVGAAKFRSHQALLDACETTENHTALISSFDQLLNEFDSKHAMDTYILCLTEHCFQDTDGLLSMWRGYGANGGGVAVVFDTTKLRSDDKLPFIVSKVTYADQSTRIKWIEDKITSLALAISKHEKTQENLHAASYGWLERLKLFSLFTKHSGFSEEGEWRVVYLSDRDKEQRFAKMLGYTISNRGVEPKLKLKIKELRADQDNALSLDTLIERIILGPSISTILATNSVRRMLELNQRASLAGKVVASSIPFRP
ncbi:DUF2971 domain-containing protein [Nitrospira sp. BLG_1]|uniref:DUF2971 domain-containing protein n=1 Tax=Nitrospira sp. BLG_1 TaxID=3395883 RepID=UPI0039BD2796